MLKNFYLALKECNFVLIDRLMKQLLFAAFIVSNMVCYGIMSVPVGDTISVWQDSIIRSNLRLHTHKPKELKYIKAIAERYTVLHIVDSAIRYWHLMTLIDANSDTAYYYRAKLLHEHWAIDSATDAIQHALAIQPQCMEYLSLYAHLCFESKKDSQCLTTCDQLLSIDTMNVDALLLSGIELSHAQQYDMAIERLNRCIFVTPNTTALLYRAELLVIKGEYKAALADYTAIHADTIANVEVLNDIGICYYRVSEYSRAIALFQRALMLEYLSPQCYYNKGLSYYGLQDFDTASLAIKATPILWDSSSTTPKQERFLDAMYCLALCYKKTGNLETAKKHFLLLQKDGYSKELSQEIKHIEYALRIAHYWYYCLLLLLLVMGMIVAVYKMVKK